LNKSESRQNQLVL